MRVAIASRIFDPEPSAASFRLAALASGFARSGDRVRVLTVQPVKQLREPGGAATEKQVPYRVTRFPVLRDRSGYVRGYLQYLSFDIPLFFRILFGPKQDAIIVEPPPTTVLFATLAASIRRTPVFAYAADVWSDASASTGAPSLVVNVVRRMERFAWNRARGVYSVNAGVTERVRQIAPRAVVETVGNGIDTAVFTPDAGDGAAVNGAAGDGAVGNNGAGSTARHPYAIYTGTASEWQGAEIFVRAIAQLQDSGTPLKLVFLGQGTALPALKLLAEELGADVEFHDPVPPAQAAVWQRGAAVSVASIKPGAGYDFAYPTKIFAAWACGTPVVYAGPGPAREVLAATPHLGAGVDFDPGVVAAALKDVACERENSRPAIAAWAQANVSLAGVADRATSFTHARLHEAHGSSARGRQ